jgi:hypothetical protein
MTAPDSEHHASKLMQHGGSHYYDTSRNQRRTDPQPTQRHAIDAQPARHERKTGAQPTHTTQQAQLLIGVAIKPLVVAVKAGAAGLDFALLMVAAPAIPPGAQIMAVAKGLSFALAVIAALGIIVIEPRAVLVDVALEAAVPAIAVVIIVSGSGLRRAKGQVRA